MNLDKIVSKIKKYLKKESLKDSKKEKVKEIIEILSQKKVKLRKELKETKEQILSKIRGHISHKESDKAKIILKELDELADNYKFVKHIEIQQIMLKNNSEEKDKLVKFAESGKK